MCSPQPLSFQALTNFFQKYFPVCNYVDDDGADAHIATACIVLDQKRCMRCATQMLMKFKYNYEQQQEQQRLSGSKNQCQKSIEAAIMAIASDEAAGNATWHCPFSVDLGPETYCPYVHCLVIAKQVRLNALTTTEMTLKAEATTTTNEKKTPLPHLQK